MLAHAPHSRAGICGCGTDKQTGRAAFGEMVAYLNAEPSVRVMLVEETDRLYCNSRIV